jgi:pyruvate, orthophosphate dikinase
MANRLVSLKSPDAGFSSDLLGGKGFNLWKMAQAGIPVPPACIISTDVCREYMANPDLIEMWVRDFAIPRIKADLTEAFGYMPLVSVRSGSKFSMPGMMDTLLNVGICSSTVAYWADKLGPECLADSASRLASMYKDVVKLPLPDDADDQLFYAIIAVLKSWNNDRAKTYRAKYGISELLGTAVTVQAMVFGNLNDKSATGVMFSRDPASGDNEYRGEFLINAQGEDVVAGIRTPMPLSGLSAWNAGIAEKLFGYADQLEAMNRDMQDIEFTVQDGHLFILQTRNGKRTSQAAVKIAVDMVALKMISVAEALERVSARDVLDAARPALDPAWVKANPPLATGLAASPGVAVGKAVFSSEDAIKEAANGPVILITQQTDPDDINGMFASAGILTAAGGMTSHAAVVARGANKVAVVGCGQLTKGSFSWSLSGIGITKGATVVLDGASGNIWVNVEPKMVGGTSGALKDFLSMLGDHYGYHEVATKVSDVANAKRVVLPAYLLGVAEFEASVAKMAAVADDLIIDLRDVAVEPESAPLAMLWGPTPSAKTDKVMSLINLKLGVKVITGSAEADKLLSDAGYSVLPVISSWMALQDTDAELVVADHAALARAKTSVAEVLTIKKSEGKNLASFNCVTQVAPNDFKGSAKFALPALSAAFSLLR